MMNYGYHYDDEPNSNGGVMVKVLSQSAVDHGFEHRSAQTKDWKNGIYCFSAKHVELKSKIKDLIGLESG